MAAKISSAFDLKALCARRRRGYSRSFHDTQNAERIILVDDGSKFITSDLDHWAYMSSVMRGFLDQEVHRRQLCRGCQWEGTPITCIGTVSCL